MKGGKGWGKLTASRDLLYGRRRSRGRLGQKVKVGTIWKGQRADQAKDGNGQSTEGMGKHMLFVCKWHRQSSWSVLRYNKVVLQFSSH